MHTEVALDPRRMGELPRAKVLSAVQLVHEASGGDLDAFEQLVRSLQRRVYGFAYQHLRDSEEAHDLAQEIFVKLFRNLARYDSERPFEPWFWKLAANTTINYRRKRVPIPAEPQAESADPNSTMQTHDPQLVEALSQLDPSYRLPILPHYYA